MSKNRNHKELYDRAVAVDGDLTVAELAKEFGLRAPLFGHYVALYAEAHGLPMPKLTYTKKRPAASVKLIYRGGPEHQVRLNPIRLAAAGFAETTEFKVICDPTHQVLVLTTRDVQARDFEALAQELLVEKAGSPLKNAPVPLTNLPVPLRFPETGTAPAAKRRRKPETK